jgi:hypothetical protein
MVSTLALDVPLADACTLSRSRRNRNDASSPCALQGVSPAIFGSLTLPSSLAACGGVRCLNPFPRGLGSGPAGSAAVGRAPVVRDLVELSFHNFLPLFANVAPTTDPASLLIASQRDGLTLRIVGPIMFLLDLACSTKASGQKVRAKCYFWWFSFATYLGENGRYQFPLTSTRNYEVSSSR